MLLILELMLCLSLLTLKTHGHCCSTQCVIKSLNMLSRSENTVKAKRLILSCQFFMMTVPKLGQKVQQCDAASLVLTEYKGDLNKKNFKIKLLQYYSCTILSLCGSVIIVIKYQRLTPRLIKNNSPQKRINID